MSIRWPFSNSAVLKEKDRNTKPPGQDRDEASRAQRQAQKVCCCGVKLIDVSTFLTVSLIDKAIWTR